MLKDDPKKTQQSQLDEDLQFMLSSIRARQNVLIFFLQRFKTCISLNSSQFKLSKNQYQQKQKIYSRQINGILQKHNQFSFGNLHIVRAFWVKLKTIMKVSIQRIMSLNIGHIQKLYSCYQKSLSAINRNADLQKSLSSYKQVQNILKKRNIQILLLGRQTISPSSISYSQSKIQKNRSQTLFKPQSSIGISRFTLQNQDSNTFSKGQTYTLINRGSSNYRDNANNAGYKLQTINGLGEIEQQQWANNNNQFINQPKIKSLNRIKNRRPEQIIKANILNFIKVEQLGKLKNNGNGKASQKYIKKINRHVEKYEKNFQGAFDGRYQLNSLLDKKKTIVQNIYTLYDNLFAKNIPNHKMISKFMFNTTKINQILYNAYEKKKKLTKKQKEKQTKQGKQKQKQKQTKQGKQKQSHPQKKIKQKDKDSMQQKQKQSNNIKSKNHLGRKIQSAKDYRPIQIINISTRQKQYVRQKKQSQMTAITSKQSNNNHQKQFFGINIHEKPQKGEKQKQRLQKLQKQKQRQKQKKVLRSKTAKVKLNSEIQNPHLQVINHNIFNTNGKHFISHQHNNNIIKDSKAGNLDKFVAHKISGNNN